MTAADKGAASDVVRISNGFVAVEVCAARGAEVRYLGSPHGPNWLFWREWQTPLRHSKSVSYGSDELDWLSHWRGGWQELFPNAGAPSSALGVPLPFHGEVSSARWEITHLDATSITLRAATRLPLVLTRRMHLAVGRPVLFIKEFVDNESELTVPFVWGHHPAFDAVPGTIIDVAAKRVVVPMGYPAARADLEGGETRWPYAKSRAGTDVDLRLVPEGAAERVVYLPDVSAGWAALRRTDGTGLAMAWDADVHPHLWVWTQIGGPAFPFFGRARAIAVEPAASWPNDGLAPAVERGQAHELGPRQTMSNWLTVVLLDDAHSPVDGVTRDGVTMYSV